MPISALESSQMFLGGATAPGVGLCSSLFLNRPTLLPLPTGTGTGLISAAHACSPSSASRMSPDSCSASLCSSPASYCSYSEASPPPLGGAMAEWHLQQPITQWRGGVSHNLKTKRLFNWSHFSIPPLISSTPSNKKPKIYWTKEGRVWEYTTMGGWGVRGAVAVIIFWLETIMYVNKQRHFCKHKEVMDEWNKGNAFKRCQQMEGINWNQKKVAWEKRLKIMPKLPKTKKTETKKIGKKSFT